MFDVYADGGRLDRGRVTDKFDAVGSRRSFDKQAYQGGDCLDEEISAGTAKKSSKDCSSRCDASRPFPVVLHMPVSLYASCEAKKSLRHLSMSPRDFDTLNVFDEAGPIPWDLGRLATLQILNLSENILTGEG